MITKLRHFLGRSALSKELSRGAAGSVLVKVGGTLVALLLTVLQARLMGAQNYGLYSYVLSLVSLLAIPAQLGLPNLVIRETAKAQTVADWPLMRGLWYWAGWLAGLLSLVTALLAWGAVALNWATLSAEQTPVFIAGLILVPLIALGNLRDGALRGLRYVVLGQLPELVLRPALLLLAMLGLWFVWPDNRFSPEQVMSLNAAVAALTFVIAAWMLRQKRPVELMTCPRHYHSRAWLLAALPLAFVAGMQLINQHVAVLILGYFLPAQDIGIFKVATSVAGAVSFALSAVNMVLAPYFARLYAQDDKARLQRLVTLSNRAVLAFSVPVVAVLVLFGQWLLIKIFGADYGRGYQALTVLVVGQLVNAATGSVALLLNMTGFERDTAKGFTVSALLNVALNLVLIPFFGMMGAALAAAVSTALWNLLLLWLVYRRLGIVSFAWGPKTAGAAKTGSLN